MIASGAPPLDWAAMAHVRSAQVDRLQSTLAKLPQTEMPVVHRFTPGLYVREIFMPKGTLVISKIHKTEHPYVVSKGHAAVWTEEAGVVQIKAPHCGITKPGTRRILYIHEDCIWTTFHPTTETDLDKIEAQVIEPHSCEESNVLDVDSELLKQLQNTGREVLCPGQQ